MAPTEVLAGQHARSVADLLRPMGGVAARVTPSRGSPDQQRSLFEGTTPASVEPTVRFAMLTGSVTGKGRERVSEGIEDGSIDLVIGTHALVQGSVTFHDLSLAVIDEQHRFGLHQRMALKGKGSGDIDVLIMTATPIPRTLALTYYGDLDVVVVDEMPRGRGPIQTRVVRDAAARAAAETLVRQEVAAGRQAFVVCAAIDEANRNQVKAAEAEAIRLRTEVFPDLRVELLHGRMRPKEKERVMDAFRDGSRRRADLHHRDRGRCRRAQRHGDAGGERGAVRAGAAPPAPRADRPRSRCLVLRVVRCVRGDERRGEGASRRDGSDDRWIRAGR